MSQPNGNKPPTIPIDPRIILPMLGILVAPFIGLLFNAELGLGILVICLGVVGIMTMKASEFAPPQQARTLRFGGILNLVMAVAALLLLLVRI